MSASAGFCFVSFCVPANSTIGIITLRSFSLRPMVMHGVGPALNRTSEHMLERDRLCVFVCYKKA